MPLPVSEFDALGSDSEGERRIRAAPSSQELPPYRHKSRLSKHLGNNYAG